ncbi:MAG: 30S ribosomal protein S6 [Nitrospirae bacterium]|nr:30S ribosomal protein S6 [Nitrospirota bacterium]
MNVYENIIILNASLSDEEIDTAMTKIKEFVTGQGGEILKINIWGKRKLAYEINKQKRGLYALLIYKIPPAIIKKLEEFYKLFDAVIKYSIINLSTKQVENLEKTESVDEPIEHKKES